MPLNTSNTVIDSNSKSPPLIKNPTPPLNLNTTGPMPVPRTSPSIITNNNINNNSNGIVVNTTSSNNSSSSNNVRSSSSSSSILGTNSATVGSTSGVVGTTSAPLVSPAETASSSATTSTSNQNKIMGRNVNGTMVMTSAPSNEAELQLYRVMQRASLLAYYDTLLEMGGDDVQQLCEAGEEEFLEIMALVGMASKPLHVRRLQKALQEWVNNPAMFQAPIMPGLSSVGTPASSSQIGSPGFSSAISSSSQSSQHEGSSATRAINLSASLPPPPISQSPAPPQMSPIQGCALTRPSPPANNGMHPSRHGSPSPSLQLASSLCGSSGGAPSPGLPLHVHGADSLSPGSPPPLQLTPTLAEPQIIRLAESAKQLASSLPSLEPKPQNSKKRICKDLEYVMNMPEDDPRRMEEIRKYAAIYGRFDCKRKPEKPLTLHEVSVNEAAAQICRLVPALLTRRDELFPLARQVVRDSGYQYSKTHTNEFHSSALPGGFSSRPHNGDDVSSSNNVKRMRLLDPSEINQDLRRQERLEQISEELRTVAERQDELRSLASGGAAENVWQSQLEALNSRHTQLALEQQELGRHRHTHSRGYRRSARISASNFGEGERPDTDDTDSQFSYSNTSSPSQDVGDSRDSTTRDGEATTTNCGDLTTRSITIKSPNKILTKQLVQETLLGEGLRVVKEMVASQEQEGPPPAHLQGHARNQFLHHYDAFFHQENKVQVISASGGNIIAVANPALSMSPAIHAVDSVDIKINSPRPASASSHHPMSSLLAQFKHEPLSPCKSE